MAVSEPPVRASGAIAYAEVLFRQPGTFLARVHAAGIYFGASPCLLGDWMALWRSLVVNIIHASRGNCPALDSFGANANAKKKGKNILKFSGVNLSPILTSSYNSERSLCRLYIMIRSSILE